MLNNDMRTIEPEEIRLSVKLIRTIFVETLRGKSLARTLMNYCLSDFELTGNIIELGSGSVRASYYRFIKFREPYNLTHVDYYKTGPNYIKMDLEKPFPVEHDSFDWVMCFNTLEHIYNFENVVKESYRILKKGGLFIGSAPFLYPFHPDPHDYLRYSHEALLKMFEKENYICRRMLYCGLGPFSTSIAHWATFLPIITRPWPILPGIFLDAVFHKFSKSSIMRYPLGYVFAFEKPMD